MINLDSVKTFIDELRPALQGDGGDVEIVGYDDKDKQLQLRFSGTCSHCGILDVTLNQYIREELIKNFPEIQDVVAV